MGPTDFVGFHAQFHPHRLALKEMSTGREWDYRALDLAVSRCAAVLAATYNLKMGDRVGVLARNCAEMLIVHFACSRLAAIYVALNWRLAPEELRSQAAAVDCALIIGDSELDRANLDGIQIEYLAKQLDDAEPLSTPLLDFDRPALILFTSGTSGQPKGAVLSERNLHMIGLNSGFFSRVTIDSRYLIDSPLFHIIGIATCVRSPMMQGGAAILSEGFDPEQTLARLSDPELGITHYFCVPQMSTMLRQSEHYTKGSLKHLTALFTGGAPHPEDQMMAWLDDGVPVVNAYGMSEAGSVFFMPIDIDQIRSRPQSVGIGVPGIASRVVDANLQDCPPGVPGELLLKGENIFLGYWPNPTHDQTAFTEDGWFRTGDIVQWRGGYFDLIDRKKDMYISGGENVYPAESEVALAGYPGVAEIAVIGVPDARWGEVGHAFLVPCAGQHLDVGAIEAFLAKKIAKYKLPKHWSIVDALPRTPSGKVQKAALRQRSSNSMF